VETQQSAQPQQKNWIDYGSKFGMQQSTYYQVVYVNPINNLDQEMEVLLQEEKTTLAAQWLEEQLPLLVQNTVIFRLKHTHHLAILFQKKQPGGLEDILLQIAEQLFAVLPIQLAFSFGTPHERMDFIGTSYVEAKLAYEEAASMDVQPLIHHYHHMGIMNLFERAETEEVHYFCQSILKELAYPEEENLIELRKTLKTYLDFQCEIAKTAKELFIHRNTVKYRIDNCETIVGMPIADPINSLNLRLALSLSQQENH
ncbi:helix-turn-helix domain-containing protein, partial [Carnobacterium sp.]|uniref:PucR family transcriptional regulator n=1 Tax=Carnobacterium sp. TaxID=48221 RepID=UPI0028AC53EB